jgi:8-oxo-dGTP pyrophosphatase MutT (NUDIX family)
MPPDGSTVVLFKDDTKKEVFLVFRSDYPIWGTTGGAIEKNETPEEAALREAYEETGFKTKIIKYCGTYQLTHNKLHLYEGRIISGKFKPEFPGCKGKWFNVNQLPKDMVTPWPALLSTICKSHPLTFLPYLYLPLFLP